MELRCIFWEILFEETDSSYLIESDKCINLSHTWISYNKSWKPSDVVQPEERLCQSRIGRDIDHINRKS